MNKLTIGLGVLALLSIIMSVYVLSSEPKVAYIHVQEVYNDFEYKKELEKKYETTSNSRKRILDSLEIQLNAIATNIQNSEVNKEENIQRYQYMVAEFQNKQQVFTEDNQRMEQQYTEQIWNQLNQYIKEFGEKNGYDFIHGADGSGSVMHADEKYNQTQQLKDFVNERYQGGGLKSE